MPTDTEAGTAPGAGFRVTPLARRPARGPHQPTSKSPGGSFVFQRPLAGACPGAAVAGAGAQIVEPLVRVDHPAVTVESVKPAEDRSEDVVVRLYESRGDRVRATLTPGLPVGRAEVTGLLERPLRKRLGLELRPFQILTLRLRPE